MNLFLKRVTGILLAASLTFVPLTTQMNRETGNIAATATASTKNDINTNRAIIREGNTIYASYIEKISSRKNELSTGKVTVDGQTMKISVQKIGKPMENGYPLYIALRGGGVEDRTVANEQFEAMQNYYNNEIKSGIYIVPQPIAPQWDEHYRPESFQFYDRIIEDAIAFYNVDPNRVYLMGFSSGGDGVYAISPRYADRLAAINMSSGYPHVLRVGNLYHLPMCIQVGERDTDYDRNKKAAQFDALLNTYAKTYGGGFQHETFIHVNGNHNNWDDVFNTSQRVYTGNQVANWLKNPSSAKVTTKRTGAVDWVNQYTRDPLPKKVVWEPAINAGLRDSQAFYWLDCDGDFPDTVVVASYDSSKNLVNIEQCDAKKGTLKIYLNPQMVDVFQDVTIKCGGKSFRVRPIVSRQIMKSTLEARGDRDYMFTSEIDLTFTSKGISTVDTVSKTKTSYVPSSKEYLSWDENGFFTVDNRLFGLTFQELTQKLGYDLPKPEKWNYWGNGLSWASKEIDSNGRKVIFMFQSGKTAIIYSEEAGNIRSSLKDTAEKYFGENTDTFANGGLCRYFLENNNYDNKNHVQQKYVYYQYKE